MNKFNKGQPMQNNVPLNRINDKRNLTMNDGSRFVEDTIKQRTYNYTRWRSDSMKTNLPLIEQGVLAIALGLSKPALRLFQLLTVKRENYGWWVTLEPSKTNSEVSARSRAFKELEGLGLVKRGTKNHTYMISPGFLIPAGDDAKPLVQEWNSLKPHVPKLQLLR
jgi:hypothetical protein